MAYSERNDEQGDASFDSFVETEPLVPAVELEVLVLHLDDVPSGNRSTGTGNDDWGGCRKCQRQKGEVN